MEKEVLVTHRFCVAPMMDSVGFQKKTMYFSELEPERVLRIVLLVVRPITAAAQSINGWRVEQDRASDVRFCPQNGVHPLKWTGVMPFNWPSAGRVAPQT